jgi:hypothetical protein
MMMAMSRWRENYAVKYPKMRMYLIDILHDAMKFLMHKSMLPYYEEIIDDIMGKGLKLPFEHPIPLGFDISFYKAYERKDFDAEIELENTSDPKKHKKTFLGKYGDTKEMRDFYAQYGKKSDFICFLTANNVQSEELERKQPFEIALAATAG